MEPIYSSAEVMFSIAMLAPSTEVMFIGVKFWFKLLLLIDRTSLPELFAVPPMPKPLPTETVLIEEELLPEDVTALAPDATL